MLQHPPFSPGPIGKDHYDAVVVGARCAGAATAMLLARGGYDVLLLDQATLPEVLLVYRASDQASRGVGECTACS